MYLNINPLPHTEIDFVLAFKLRNTGRRALVVINFHVLPGLLNWIALIKLALFAGLFGVQYCSEATLMPSHNNSIYIENKSHTQLNYLQCGDLKVIGCT